MTRTVMFACVTVEVAMLVSPAVYYKPDEIHLFRFIRDPGTKRAELYEDHYMEVCRQLQEGLPDTDVIEHCSDPVYDFRAMAGKLGSLRISLLTEHPDARFLVNISSGPAELIAALGVFCFLNRDAIMFKVSTREYSISEEDSAPSTTRTAGRWAYPGRSTNRRNWNVSASTPPLTSISMRTRARSISPPRGSRE